MQDVVVGLIAIGVGAVFCFRGYLALRLVIPLWGALAGFFLGAGLTANWFDEDLLATLTGWLVGLAVALVFGALAYLYYEVSVIIGMGAIGFSLGTGLMVALGVRWSWLVILVGLAGAALLAVVAVLGDLPMLLLTLLSASAGAVAIIGGAMLLVGTLDVASFDAATTTERIDDDWWWYVAYLVAVGAGIIAQVRALDQARSLRDSWAEDGGRQLRA